MPHPTSIIVPSGAIVMWSGAAANIPKGYYLCDGTNGTPDLRDRFIVGAGTTYNVGDTGGAATHSHGVGSLVTGVPSATTAATAGANNVGNATHTHTITGSTAAVDGQPPYYALYFIQKA